ncbi:hypothetical protein GLOIN_2v1620891 [Rhizophagus clarus]|uniref:Uncharacterized protein n=1 Tax=Rhizophagus clarus TaxID=94130 RepID=A0A8H3QHM7_9GLOM|nr:hypothetical protein GLOIN_2v1620891 [Rhizophagus clarus]
MLKRQIIEENTKRKAKNTELKSKVVELEARLAILEQSSLIVSEQPQNKKEVSSDVSVDIISDSLPIHEVHSQLKLTEQIEEVPKLPDQEKTSEDMETNAFLIKIHKKSISNKIRKRNKEKKLSKAVEDQVSLQKIFDTTSSISSSEKLVSTKNGTSDAEGLAMKANQKKILSWYLYAKEFLIMINDIMANGNVSEKKAKGQVYDFIIQQLPDTKRENLCKQTQRAIKIFNLFEKIGIDKVQYIITYSANSISKITNEELQKVIDHFSN